MEGHVRLVASVLSSTILLVGCATSVRPCGDGTQAAVHDHLYFGTARKGGPISPEEWSSFVADTVTPRFPQGFTVWDATGQWRDDDGRIIREGTHVLSVAHVDDVVSERAVRDIAAAYRTRFDQQGVYRVTTAVCSGDLER